MTRVSEALEVIGKAARLDDATTAALAAAEAAQRGEADGGDCIRFT